ncbi:MAG: L,D-transpeptidase family protein [Lachnospiraceae bacterium]|nr:L,D-transpeptidase family protein [Lachnospiraceae bacterium]
MKALKDFILHNKVLVSVTGSVTMAIFLVFTVIAVAISGTPGGDVSTNANSTEPSGEDTTINIADNSTGSTENSGNTGNQNTDITVPSYDGTEDSAGSEKDTTEEPTTEPPVDPYTLPYKIMVNRAANCLTVYKKDSFGNFTEPIKAITVSCGKNLGDTPSGSFQTKMHYDWRMMVDDTFAQYAYRIQGSILFHSVPYFTQRKDDLEWEEYNKLGTSASLGCVRMTVADAKWLIDNCPRGTLVEIYDDAANPGPLGKPDTIKIPANSPYKGWDPTDPDPANPWKLFYASITHPASKYVVVTEGATIEDIRIHFSAKDTCGNDITDKIKFTGDLNLDKPGIYSDIVVSVTDAIGSHAELTITVEVQSDEPITDEPSTDEPSTDEPSTDEPSTDEPSTDEPSTDEPSTDEPSTDEPSTDEPSTDEPSTEEPSSEESSSEEPSSEEPSSEEPSSEESSSENGQGSNEPIA